MLGYYLICCRTDLIYESYVPKQEDRDKRSLVKTQDNAIKNQNKTGKQSTFNP